MSDLGVNRGHFIGILFIYFEYLSTNLQQKRDFQSVFSEISENRTIPDFIPINT